MESISQYQLKNASGHPSEFAFDDWGVAEINQYDHLQAHRHHFYEIMIFTSGEAQHDIDFVTHQVKGKAAHFMAPDNVHLLIRNEENTGFSLQFEKGFIDDKLLYELPFYTGQPHLVLSDEILQQITSLYSLIKAECAASNFESTAILRSLFQSLLLLLIRTNKEQVHQETETSKADVLVDFKTLVKKHFRSRRKVEEYANDLHISAKHLIFICKKHTGKTPLKIVQEEMIGEAKRLLFYTNQPIKEIAMNLGFEDPANFSNFFKTIAGYSPLAYREKSK